MDNTASLNKSDSDISSALHVEMDPQLIEVKENPNQVFIGNNNWRKFMIGTACAFMFVTLFFIANIIVYLIDFQPYYNVFKGYGKLHGFHAIVGYVAFFLSLAIPSVLPSIGRTFSVFLFAIITICYLYIPALFVKAFYNSEMYYLPELMLGYIMWACAVLGFFINIVTTRKKINIVIASYISMALFIILMAVYVYVLKRTQPYMLVMFGLVILCGLIAAYLSKDAKFMLEKRCDFYLTSDWFLGFVHLHTDIFFRFWADFFRKKVVVIDTDELNGKSLVLSSAIKRSRNGSIDIAMKDVVDMDRTNVTGILPNKSFG